MRYFILLGAILAATSPLAASPFSHDLFDQVLQSRVDSLGCVDYAGLRENRTSLDAYIDSLARYNPQSYAERFPSRDHELAYWINAYNAFVLRGVIDAYPVDSVQDIMYLSGFFNRLEFVAGGQVMTLDHIENEIIRPHYKDPRIHFVVNCGAVSCPALENRAFDGAALDERLSAARQRFIEDPKHFYLDRQNETLELSKILDWYGEDFIRFFPSTATNIPASPQLIDYFILYLDEDRVDFLRRHADIPIIFKDYDWQLNRQHRHKKEGIVPRK